MVGAGRWFVRGSTWTGSSPPTASPTGTPVAPRQAAAKAPRDGAAKEPYRNEVRRNVDGGDRTHPPRRRARAARGGGRRPGAGCRIRDGRRDRPPRPAVPRGRGAPRSDRI